MADATLDVTEDGCVEFIHPDGRHMIMAPTVSRDLALNILGNLHSTNMGSAEHPQPSNPPELLRAVGWRDGQSNCIRLIRADGVTLEFRTSAETAQQLRLVLSPTEASKP